MSSKILKAIHDSAKSLHDAGIMNIITMREFDALCLEPIKKMTPNQIKKIRLKERISQPVFASFLNVSPSTVKKWETGEKVPSGIALRMLNIVDHKGLSIIRD